MAPAISWDRPLKPRVPVARVLLISIVVVAIFFLSFQPASERVKEITQHFEHLEHLHDEPESPPPLPDCSINSTRLQSLQKQYQLQEDIEYAQRYIRINRKDMERKSLTKIKEDLFPEEFEIVNINNPQFASACWNHLEITVPYSRFPNTADASELLFGISTTYQRLTDAKLTPILEWAHWLTDGQGNSNGAGLILRVLDASDSQLRELTEYMISLGIDVKISHSDKSLGMAQRYFALLPALYSDASRKHRKWLVLCDDDTFFPSIHSLISRLSVFNHKTDMYIGTFSEDVNNIQRHGSQAFGGAGVFFSVHMVSVVSKLYDQCNTPQKLAESDTGWGQQGDVLLRKCIYENTEVRLNMMPELHQLDIQGDPSGFYESGIAPLSLHHFKGGFWHTANPYEGSKIIHACGEACFMQRFQTEDGFIISNGYSIAYYPKGIQFDASQMERTFHAAPDDHGWNLDFMLGGPGRKSLAGTGRKVAWELKEVVVQYDGSFRQSYVRKADDERWRENGKAMFELDGVLELVWVP